MCVVVFAGHARGDTGSAPGTGAGMPAYPLPYFSPATSFPQAVAPTPASSAQSFGMVGIPDGAINAAIDPLFSNKLLIAQGDFCDNSVNVAGGGCSPIVATPNPNYPGGYILPYVFSYDILTGTTDNALTHVDTEGSTVASADPHSKPYAFPDSHAGFLYFFRQGQDYGISPCHGQSRTDAWGSDANDACAGSFKYGTDAPSIRATTGCPNSPGPNTGDPNSSCIYHVPGGSLAEMSGARYGDELMFVGHVQGRAYSAQSHELGMYWAIANGFGDIIWRVDSQTHTSTCTSIVSWPCEDAMKDTSSSFPNSGSHLGSGMTTLYRRPFGDIAYVIAFTAGCTGASCTFTLTAPVACAPANTAAWTVNGHSVSQVATDAITYFNANCTQSAAYTAGQMTGTSEFNAGDTVANYMVVYKVTGDTDVGSYPTITCAGTVTCAPLPGSSSANASRDVSQHGFNVCDDASHAAARHRAGYFDILAVIESGCSADGNSPTNGGTNGWSNAFVFFETMGPSGSSNAATYLDQAGANSTSVGPNAYNRNDNGANAAPRLFGSGAGDQSGDAYVLEECASKDTDLSPFIYNWGHLFSPNYTKSHGGQNQAPINTNAFAFDRLGNTLAIAWAGWNDKSGAPAILYEIANMSAKTCFRGFLDTQQTIETLSGTTGVGNSVTTTVNGTAFTYNEVSGDTTATIAAASTNTFLNGQAGFNANYTATSSGATVTIIKNSAAGQSSVTASASGTTLTVTYNSITPMLKVNFGFFGATPTLYIGVILSRGSNYNAPNCAGIQPCDVGYTSSSYASYPATWTKAVVTNNSSGIMSLGAGAGGLPGNIANTDDAQMMWFLNLTNQSGGCGGQVGCNYAGLAVTEWANP